MAEPTDYMALNNDQCVIVGEDGITWLIQKVENEYGFKNLEIVMKPVAAAATRLFDFLLLYEEQLVCWRDGLVP